MRKKSPATSVPSGETSELGEENFIIEDDM